VGSCCPTAISLESEYYCVGVVPQLIKLASGGQAVCVVGVMRYATLGKDAKNNNRFNERCGSSVAMAKKCDAKSHPVYSGERYGLVSVLDRAQ
jgi:hypothetical protein